MAEPFDTLLRVQDHDTLLDQLRHRIETLPERTALGQKQQERSTRAAAEATVQSAVDDLAKRQQQLEEQIAASAKRRHDIEKRMQSGEVSASRDLQAMDQEVHQLVERQSQLEEEEVALMEEEEPLDLLLDEHRGVIESLTAEMAALEAAILEIEAEIRVAIASEEVLRAEAAAGLPDELAERYEFLRSRLGGVGAARLVGDHCDGCHLTLSSAEVQRIRHLPPEEFATCAECDRILVH